MRTETCVVTVLPLTIAAGAPFHVSLHIAPRLVPDGGTEPLGNFELFREWSAHLDGAQIQLFNEANQLIAAKPLLGPINAKLWSQLFPPETPVRGQDFTSLANRDWASFPVKTVHDLSALTALFGTLLFPIDPPDLKDYTNRRESPVSRLIRQLGPDDGRLTKLLDAGGTGANDNPWLAVLRPLHKARRFYERREAAQPYQRKPTDGLKEAKLPAPKVDFHDRVAHLADQPEMLRRLGLVIDVHVDDLALLAKAQVLHARIGIRGSQAAMTEARTPVSHSGDRLLTVPRTGDWTLGRLRLGDEKLFATLAMDSDGAALKLENYIRSLPRMLDMAENGDPGTVAPAALRSEGLAVVRSGRAAQTQAQVATATAMVASATPQAPPTLATEDVTRGLRVEIWDDHEGKWFNPHLRLATATFPDGKPIYKDHAEAGSVHAATASETPGANGPLYLHESMFGWSGWSLSAPRPGPRAVPDGPKENVESAKPEADISKVLVTTRVMPGTLPRLRYGRSYAFRAWGVDLAGNSQGGDVPEKLAGPPSPSSRQAGATVVTERIPTRFAASVAVHYPAIHSLAVHIAGDTARPAPLARITDLRGTTAAIEAPAITGDADVDRIATARLATRSLKTSVSSAQMTSDTLRAAVAVAHIDTATAIKPAMFELNDVVAAAPQGITITPLTPFRRWDPVLPPAVVARHRFSAAESVHHMVIRSGVAADGTASDPASYIAEITAIDPAFAKDWRVASERHLAAPKGSQHLNELHGRFDLSIDDPTTRRRMLAAALRDDGTLMDRKIVDLNDPSATIDQPGVTLEAGPEIANPETDLSKYEGDHRGDAIPPGYYIVHDVDDLALPYLPDPLAAGVALGMSGANKGSPLLGLFRTESTAARFLGDWPAPQPFRLVLTAAPTATANITGNVITIGLPPGTRLDLKLSSSLNRADLPLMALWMLIPEAFRKLDLVERPAADSQFWGLTPFQPISLVHAVPRPVLAPLITTLAPLRAPAATNVAFAGVIDCHASSTDRIDAEASWSEWVDDIAAAGPVREDRKSVPYHVQIDPDEDMVLLAAADTSFAFPGVGDVRIHRAIHEFGDTRHRLVDYAFRGTTRFREYFSPVQLATPDSRSIVGDPKQLRIPSSARPAAPIVNSVIPLFRWDEETDPGQPFGLRRRRRSGLRIYLERPWYTTGDDEQLAILLGVPGSQDPAYTSLWGADPVWLNAGPPSRLVGLSVEDLYDSVGIDKERGPEDRISPPATAILQDVKGQPQCTLLGYRPEYNADRKLWFVDVAIEPAAAIWPFVRLAVARYQPHSLPGLELSPPAICDFTQLPPERTMTVSRPDDSNVRVTVTGPIGLRTPINRAGVEGRKAIGGDASPYPLGAADPTNVVANNRRVYAIVERLPAGATSDLDWDEVHRQELSIGGLAATGDWAWTGVVPVGKPVGPATPGAVDEWRVTVEEHEAIEGDPASLDTKGPLVQQWRLIYADRTLL